MIRKVRLEFFVLEKLKQRVILYTRQRHFYLTRPEEPLPPDIEMGPRDTMTVTMTVNIGPSY